VWGLLCVVICLAASSYLAQLHGCVAAPGVGNTGKDITKGGSAGQTSAAHSIDIALHSGPRPPTRHMAADWLVKTQLGR